MSDYPVFTTDVLPEHLRVTGFGQEATRFDGPVLQRATLYELPTGGPERVVRQVLELHTADYVAYRYQRYDAPGMDEPWTFLHAETPQSGTHTTHVAIPPVVEGYVAIVRRYGLRAFQGPNPRSVDPGTTASLATPQTPTKRRADGGDVRAAADALAQETDSLIEAVDDLLESASHAAVGGRALYARDGLERAREELQTIAAGVRE